MLTSIAGTWPALLTIFVIGVLIGGLIGYKTGYKHAKPTRLQRAERKVALTHRD